MTTEVRVLFENTKPVRVEAIGTTHTAILTLKNKTVDIIRNDGKLLWTRSNIQDFYTVQIPDEVLEISGLVEDFPSRFGYGDFSD